MDRGTLKGLASRVAAISAIVLLTAMPFGCSKEKTNAPADQAQQAAAGKEHYDKGVQLSLKGQLDEAIKEYEASLQANPGVAEVHNNIGFAYFDKKDMDKAIEHQKKALELNPNLANAHYGLALALEAKGDKPGAVSSWKQFASLSQPHSKWWMKAQEHIQALEGQPQKKKK